MRFDLLSSIPPTPSMNAFEFALTLLIALAAAAVVFVLLDRVPLVRRFAARLQSISQVAADRVFTMLSLGYMLVFGALSILRHESFHSGGYDLGIFDQIVWNSLHGRLFQNSIMIDSPSFLGHHFSPILLGLVPLYALWSDPRVLLVVQTFALAVAALPMYWFAREQIGSALALVLGAAYFLYPSVQYVNLFEFHEIALATPLLAFAVYFLLHQRDVPFLVCLTLALQTKEEIAFITLAFGLFLFFVQHKRGLGLALTIIGVVWSVVVMLYVIPFFRDPIYGSDYYFVERYLYLGNTVPEIVSTAITQPGLVVQHLIVPVKIEFMLQLLVPLAFVPLVGAEVFALASPTFGYILIGDNAFQNSIRFQYTAPLLPFLFFAAVIGLERLLHWRSLDNALLVRKTILATFVSALSFANYFFQSAGPLARQFNPAQYDLNAHTALGYRLMQQIPAGASLMAESNFVPHLSQRMYAYQASVVPDLRKIDYLLADTTLPIHGEYEMIWKDILPSPFFETLVDQDGYILKRRALPAITHPLQMQFDSRIALLGYALPPAESARRGEAAYIVLTWRANQEIRERYITFVHLLDAQGHLWAQDDREPANGWFRTDRWNAGDATPDIYTLALPATMPPGDYQITAGLYNLANQQRLIAYDSAGRASGSEPVLGTLRVGKEKSNQPSEVKPARLLQLDLGDLQLLGYTPEFNSVLAGDKLHLGMYWHATQPPRGDWLVVVQLRDANGHVVFEQAQRPATDAYPTTQWDAGETILDWHALTLPANLVAGDYQVIVVLRDAANRAPVVEAPLGLFGVSNIVRQFIPPPMAHPLNATFNNEIKLLGYDLAQDQRNIRLTLYWQALAPMSTSYTVFTHLLDAQSRIVAQQDSLPANGTRPTTNWIAEEIITDAYTLTLPLDAPSGKYQLEIGWYNAVTGARLATTAGSDHLVLTSVDAK